MKQVRWIHKKRLQDLLIPVGLVDTSNLAHLKQNVIKFLKHLDY